MGRRYVITSEQVAKSVCSRTDLWEWYDEIHSDIINSFDGFGMVVSERGTAIAIEQAEDMARNKYKGLTREEQAND